MLKKCLLGCVIIALLPVIALAADFSQLVSDVANKQLACAFVMPLNGKQYKYEPDSIGFRVYEVKVGDNDVLLLSVWDDSEIWAYREETDVTTESELAPILEDLKSHECPQEINYGKGKITFVNNMI